VQEELMFRGLLLLSFFHTRLWFWGAALLTSLLFALIHNQFSLNIFLHAPYVFMGVAFAWALRATGSLWAPIFLHVAKNALAILMLSAS
jgi:membrane protease YdiL (CAAX protease family)